jgi:ribose transport system substrate-binding protein
MKKLFKISSLILVLLLVIGGSTFAQGISVTNELPDRDIYSSGPRGNKAASAKTLSLSEDELEEIKAGNYKAAVVMHYAGNDWSRAQIDALRETFEKMNIEVVAVTDAQFSAEKQASDIETVMARQPDVIVSIPVDPTATASAFNLAVNSGIKLVFMDNVPAGFSPGEDYASVVSADNYGNGVVSAEIMGEELNGEGKIGIVYHDADFFVTAQRYEAFKTTITENYPNIEIVEEGGFNDPAEASNVASSMLTRNPTLDGIFAVWDVPAEGVLSAVRPMGRDDMIITTIDLGENVALNIAQGGMIKGLGAQIPYWQGVAEAIIAGKALLGKDVEPYYAVPALKVTRDNLLESWKTVYNSEAPENIQNQYE